jgi:pimeloyl-ACP methyl ester carboxylesterase
MKIQVYWLVITMLIPFSLASRSTRKPSRSVLKQEPNQQGTTPPLVTLPHQQPMMPEQQFPQPNAIQPVTPTAAPEWQKSTFFDTKFLKKRDAVNKKLLTEEGFVQITMRAADNSITAALFKQKPDALYTLICFGGFGFSKETLAPLYAMFKDQPCNIWLCETRAAYQSTLRSVVEFGSNNDVDAITCIKKAYQFSHKPIVVWGTCAGAFYATRALIELALAKELANYPIKALIFDSGWGAVDEAVAQLIKGHVKEKTARATAYITGTTRTKAAQSWFARMNSRVTNWFVDAFHLFTTKPFFGYSGKKTNLFDKIGLINIPIFFIHSEDDYKEPISEARKLYTIAKKQMPNTQAWWIKFPSLHVMHHFKHKDEYKKRCIAFINKNVIDEAG